MLSPSDLQAHQGHLVVETLVRVGKTAASKVKPSTHGLYRPSKQETLNLSSVTTGDPETNWNYSKCFGLHAGIRLGDHILLALQSKNKIQHSPLKPAVNVQVR